MDAHGAVFSWVQADSEQTNTALALGVSISRDCSVRSAGGYMVQVRVL